MHTAELVPVYDRPVPAGWQMLCSALVECPGAKATELAPMVGVSTHTIRLWLKKPEFARYQTWYIHKHFDATPLPSDQPEHVPAKIRATRLKDEISEYAVEMFDRLKLIVETTENEKLVFEAAKDVMDRAGHQAARKIERAPQAFVMTPELLSMLNQRSSEAGVALVVEAVSVTPVPSDPLAAGASLEGPA